MHRQKATKTTMQQRCRVLASAGLVLLLALEASGSPVDLSGTLRDGSGASVGGTVTVVENGPPVVVSHHPVDGSGAFRIRADAARGLVVHARAPGHASEEKLVPPGASGPLTLRFLLPAGRAVEGRVVDASGNGVAGAALRVRYREPGRPPRAVAFDAERTTDGDGRFKFRDVGTGVPFVIDVHAPRYVAATSQRFTVGAGGTRALDDIVLRDSGATVVARLRDRDGAPVRGVAVLLLADPESRATETRGSWLHHRSYRQLKRTSALGNVRFSGVPPGRVIVRARGLLSAIEERASVSEGQELRLEMQVL